jgi:hypothetical protein
MCGSVINRTYIVFLNANDFYFYFSGFSDFFGGADQRRRVAKRDVYSIGADIDMAEQTNRPGRDSACLFARTAVINCLKLTREAEEDADPKVYSTSKCFYDKTSLYKTSIQKMPHQKPTSLVTKLLLVTGWQWRFRAVCMVSYEKHFTSPPFIPQLSFNCKNT